MVLIMTSTLRPGLPLTKLNGLDLEDLNPLVIRSVNDMGTVGLPTNDIEVDSIPTTVCNKCLTFLVGWIWWGISQLFFCSIILLLRKSLSDFFQTSTPGYLAAFGSIGAFLIAPKTN
jgi:hypothetical protein